MILSSALRADSQARMPGHIEARVPAATWALFCYPISLEQRIVGEKGRFLQVVGFTGNIVAKKCYWQNVNLAAKNFPLSLAFGIFLGVFLIYI